MFLQVFLIGLLGAISPGPDFAVVTRNSLSYGTRIGIATAFGIAAALTIHIAYTVGGYALILKQSLAVFTVIQLAGAIYLAWLGTQAIRSRPATETETETAKGNGEDTESKSGWQGFRDGFLCNALNPKAALYFLGIFSQFLQPGDPQWYYWIYGLENIVAVGGWFILLAVIISSPRFRKVYHRYRHWSDRLLGAVLIFFSVRILWLVVARWM
ncbi:lysine transporter LysE [Polycladomyces abyssicola]|uniref:Lysine transporter LysE n=1 Tax=Polycladomyces abyssicola TaxID=1125966 RepID=A0A8D5UE18_9BACL|nr:LysE family translocator [Polycladomyces abyssicola]BCU81425.1 lysine transporter LysE [Polycladomyces abyssicola]